MSFTRLSLCRKVYPSFTPYIVLKGGVFKGVVLKVAIMLLSVLLISACTTQSLLQKEVVSEQLIVEVDNNTAYLSGVLGGDLVDQLTQLVRNNPNITELVLVNIPGAKNQQAVIDGARLIRRLGLNTRIATTGYVLSGGVDLFLGGVERRIGDGAGVGIHAWTDGTQIKVDNIANTDPVHGTYVNFYLEMGISDRFYWFSLAAAPAERVYFLSPEEVYDFELVTH